ncbi:hypothetical protein [Halosegnis longus]|uniref:hypothetical protein n=1 Tax=Halosegnis longus TaxID=2216012 RepID=UPI0015624807|nr:hypothetical protein [Halosegnis longus]
MDLSALVSTAQFGYSYLTGQESTTEARRELFDAVVGQESSITPQNGSRISTRIQNCAYLDEEGVSLLIIRVHDPNHQRRMERLESDFKYYYFNTYRRHTSEFANPLVTEKRFLSRGPNEYNVEFRVKSRDAPTMQLLAERVEIIIANLYSDLHRYFEEMYAEYHTEYDITREMDGGSMESTITTDLDTSELIPQPNEYTFRNTSGQEISELERVDLSHRVDDYIRWTLESLDPRT